MPVAPLVGGPAIAVEPPAAAPGAAQVIERLLAGDPPVAVMGYDDPQVVWVDVRVLADDEAALVARRLRGVLGRAPR